MHSRRGLTTSPLHHRTFGSRIRRFGRLSLLSGAKALAGSSPRQPHARSGNLPCERPVTGLYDRSGLPCVAAGTMPSADSSHGVRKDDSSLSQFPWHATFRGTWEASRGKRSYCRCIDAGCIKHSPVVDGGLHGRVPARPDVYHTLYPVRVPRPAPSFHAAFRCPLAKTPLRFPCPSAPRTPGQETFTPEHDRMHGTHAGRQLLPEAGAKRTLLAVSLQTLVRLGMYRTMPPCHSPAYAYWITSVAW